MFAVPVRSVGATVTVRAAERFAVVHSPTPDDTFASWDELTGHLARFGPGDARQLVLAAIAAHAELVSDRPLDPCSIEVATTIPRSVGLAGSSAIVTATLRALAAFAGLPASEPDLLATAAWVAENEVLGIAAGLQDRVVQAYDATVLMDFGGERTVAGRAAGEYTVVTGGAPLRWFVAALGRSAGASGATHGALRRRAADPARSHRIGTVMARLAEQARLAAAAFAAGDVGALGASMDATFACRRELVELDPAHEALVAAATAAGAHANFTGSGGAVVVLAPDAEAERRARAALAGLGCSLLTLDGPSDPVAP